eukprot:TRINITY_DN2626_c0_g2_i10.p1 TRINITY_DN2626_c0_g2~~TRINITY_DN2626_c0_g2_i10.p1  ORF type:complete len:318 (-),score=41.02 TRINITY_DN2626_c0_g2_i10:254-1207(-)
MFIFSFVFASLVEMVLAQPINSSDSSTEVTACSSNSDCSSTSYCRFSVGTCSGVGECIVIPNSASCDSSISSPLCGCDGKTYQNLCISDQNSMSSSSSGSCPAPLIHGDCTSNADCTGSSFCQFAPGTCSGVGNCTAIPSYCPDATVPVCGCDGFAYQTSCNAFLRSVSVASINSCFIPAPCNQTTNYSCPANFFCQKAFGKCVGDGFCMPLPPTNGCLPVKNEVCGCDGQTYDNQCLVDKAGVSTQSNSTCGSNTESTSLNVSNAPNPSFIPNFDHNSTPRTVDPNNTPSLSTSCSSMIFRASNFLLLGYLISFFS